MGTGRGVNTISTIFTLSKKILERFVLSKLDWFSLSDLEVMYIKPIRGPGSNNILNLTINPPHHCNSLHKFTSLYLNKELSYSVTIVRPSAIPTLLGFQGTYVPRFNKISKFFIKLSLAFDTIWRFEYTRKTFSNPLWNRCQASEELSNPLWKDTFVKPKKSIRKRSIIAKQIKTYYICKCYGLNTWSRQNPIQSSKS